VEKFIFAPGEVGVRSPVLDPNACLTEFDKRLPSAIAAHVSARRKNAIQDIPVMDLAGYLLAN
jgi:hypothetical protein